jgi:ATP-dependent helicase/nuclease subunit B
LQPPEGNSAPRLFTIAPHVAFVDALADGILARCGGDPLALARAHVLLPNRRAARALTDAFVRRAGSGLLLPRLTPVGDLGDDSFDRFASGDEALPPPVSPLVRRLELARLVRQLPRGLGPGGREAGRSAVEALRLGDELGATLDALLAEEIDPERLRDAVASQELAEHWQDTLRFLEIVISGWPPARDASGGSDGGTRVAALIDALVARWALTPPAGLVIAAGVTGSSPPIVRLLAAVLGLPTGMVVLPGLDHDLSEAGERRWAAIRCDADTGRDAEAHPQYGLKLLLARLGRERIDVADWGVATERDGPAGRTAAIMAAMAPAAAADGWHGVDVASFAGVTVVEAATPGEEAQVIALALRRALETPGRSAALVTPDRGLARRVAAHCRRWGLAIDDSAGVPLRQTPPGALALALTEAMAQGFSPVALLTVLKHPLVASGDGRGDWLAAVRRLDLALRGVRPPSGLDGIGEAYDRWLAEGLNRLRRDDPQAHPAAAARAAEAMAWWQGVEAQLAPLAALGEAPAIDLPRLAAALRQTGDTLGGDRLWSGADGRALATLIERLEAEGGSFGGFERDDAPALVGAFLSDVAVRSAFGGHPRVRILGPLEAQLQRADLMILGGLNEGVWPGRPAPDPWLAPAIRTTLGLPGLARATGLAAHDFVGGLGAAAVLLTRARRDASAPLVASRFWLRLQAYSGGLASDDQLLLLARGIDSRAAPVPGRPPRPAPPAAARPRRISVTQIDTLVTDPFAFYASAVLGLKPLDPLDQDPTAATRGNRIHEVLERWVNSGPGSPEQLRQFTEEMLASEGSHFPLLRALWGPRARRAIAWAGEQIIAADGDGQTRMLAEAGGEWLLPNGITLKGRADRIDRSADGGLTIIDYKTGRVPAMTAVRNGLANQLGLLMAMAARGMLATRAGVVLAGDPAALAYWKLSGGTEPGKISDPLRGKPELLAADHAAAAVAVAIAETDALLLGEAPFVAKKVPGYGWSDFDHLARVAEWQDRPKRLLMVVK